MTAQNINAKKPSRPRNRRGEGGRLREEIIAAAATVLDETGDERAITLRSVARRIGIAAPSIYPHFADQPSIMLAVVQDEFARLENILQSAAESNSSSPRERLLAVCHAYLEFARDHPSRYRTMFGGLWMPDLATSSITPEDLLTLGEGTMQVLIAAFTACVDADFAVSDNVHADAVALWLGLHGLAHQRAATVGYPWPSDIESRLVDALAHLRPAAALPERTDASERPH